MKPVLVLQHLSGDGPAYLATWLAGRGVPLDVRNAERGDPYPRSLAGHRALAILGGEMSANDPLPTLRQAEALFLEALREGVPTLGHCLGGQLMARALGAPISDSPLPEVGFQPLMPKPGAEALAWFGTASELPVFHWHYEAFALPAGAHWLAESEACPYQAFSIGPHLAMQFHIELDAGKLERWSRDEGARYVEARQRHPATVHSGERMRSDAGALLAAHQALADRIYSRWLAAARGA
ncbi:MAG: type 1 glutamine amidotransferase [Rubrivivax sp.]|nr:type 1 glutamine amidotransferase [Rubrivivax sp.]